MKHRDLERAYTKEEILEIADYCENEIVTKRRELLEDADNEVTTELVEWIFNWWVQTNVVCDGFNGFAHHMGSVSPYVKEFTDRYPKYNWDKAVWRETEKQGEELFGPCWWFPALREECSRGPGKTSADNPINHQ